MLVTICNVLANCIRNHQAELKIDRIILTGLKSAENVIFIIFLNMRRVNELFFFQYLIRHK